MIQYHYDIIQGSDEWLSLRCGRLTASEVKLIITSTGKIASNDKERAHVLEIAAQRNSGYVEPSYVGDAMLRGREDEVEARIAYSKAHIAVDDVGFITNDKWGFTIGYSPDGLVGPNGLIECKSRAQKFQMELISKIGAAILEDRHDFSDLVPSEYTHQLQTGLLVSEREWIDFISYCGGMPMVTIRVFPDPEMQEQIVEAATAFEERVEKHLRNYQVAMNGYRRLIPTERRVEEEIMI